MTLKRFPIGEWLPDQGDFQVQNGLWKVYGAVDAGGAIYGAPGLLRENLTGGTAPYYPSEIYGFHIHNSRTDPNQIYMYVGTSDRILRSGADDATTANATAGALSTAPDTNSGWQFASFADMIVATQFGDTTAAFSVPMSYASTPTTNFATLNTVTSPTTYDPIARYVTTIKNHLLIGGVALQAGLGPFTASTVYPELVMWSATDNDAGTDTDRGIHRWGDEQFVSYDQTIGAGWQNLTDGMGPITGLGGNGDIAYIFKPKAIWRMDGPPWTFHPIVQGCGTVYPNSIAFFENDCYFWGPGGPSRLQYGSSQVETLGKGKISKSVTDLTNVDLFEFIFSMPELAYPSGLSAQMATGVKINPIDISVISDPKNGLIGWVCGAKITAKTTNVFLRPSGVLVYDINTQRFSFFQVPDWFSFAKSAPRYGRPPANFNGGTDIDTFPSPVFDGTYGLAAPDGATTTSTVALAGFFGDCVTPLTTGAQPTEEFPRFVFPYMALEEVDNMPVSTHITGIRVPFTMRRFQEEIGTETKFTTKLYVTVRTKSSMTSDAVDAPASATQFTLSSVTPDDWLPIEGVSGVYHQIEIKIVTAPVTASQYVRPTAHLRNLRYVDVAYAIDGTVGGDLP